MILDESKEKTEWRKREIEFESSYVIENRSKIIFIHENEVKNTAECNLLHDIINPPKRAKNINSHWSPIIHGCLNTRKGRSKFKNFQILLDGGYSSMIVIRRLVHKLGPRKDAVM